MPELLYSTMNSCAFIRLRMEMEKWLAQYLTNRLGIFVTRTSACVCEITLNT